MIRLLLVALALCLWQTSDSSPTPCENCNDTLPSYIKTGLAEEKLFARQHLQNISNELKDQQRTSLESLLSKVQNATGDCDTWTTGLQVLQSHLEEKISSIQQSLIVRIAEVGNETQSIIESIANEREQQREHMAKMTKTMEIRNDDEIVAGITDAILLGLSEILKSENTQTCPDSWIQIGDKCYILSKNYRNWYKASVDCENVDGQLAELGMEDFHMLALLVDHDDYYWLGGSDMEWEGYWKWSKGKTRISRRDPRWLEDHPDDDGDCLAFLAEEDEVGFLDQSCWDERKFICQRSLE